MIIVVQLMWDGREGINNWHVFAEKLSPGDVNMSHPVLHLATGSVVRESESAWPQTHPIVGQLECLTISRKCFTFVEGYLLEERDGCEEEITREDFKYYLSDFLPLNP